MVELWGNIGFLLFTVSATLFTLAYLTLSRWYKSFIGTILAAFCGGVIILSVYLSLRIWGINVPGVEWVRLVIFWALGFTMLVSVIGFLEVQFGKRGKALRERLSKRYSDVKSREDIDKERL